MHVLEALLMYQDISSEDTTHHRMVRTILENLEFVRKGTIYDTADLCYTSTSSVGRLCTRLGYTSFSAFRSAINSALDDYAFSDYMLMDSNTGAGSLKEMQHSFSQILLNQSRIVQELDTNVLERIAQLFYEKKAVHFFLPMLDPGVLLALQTGLILAGKQSYLHHGSFGQDKKDVAQVSANDVALLIVPNYPRWSYMVRIFQDIQASGAATILLITKDKSCWDGATVKVCLPGINSIIDSGLYGAVLELLSCVYRSKYGALQ